MVCFQSVDYSFGSIVLTLNSVAAALVAFALYLGRVELNVIGSAAALADSSAAQTSLDEKCRNNRSGL